MEGNEDLDYPSDKLIEDYLSGDLSAKKRTLLEQQMAEDPAIAKKVALYKKAEETLRFARKQKLKAQFLSHFNERDKTEHQKISIPESFTENRKKYRRRATVVIFLLAYGIIAFFLGQNISRKEQGIQIPLVKPDTLKSSFPPRIIPQNDPGEINTPQKTRNDIQIEEKTSASKPIAAWHLAPNQDDLREDRSSVDTIVMIKDMWNNKKYKETEHLTRLYQERHPLPSKILDLYADAAFQIKDYATAESAYRTLSANVILKKRAKWNLLVCYALQWPAKKAKFEYLAKEIESWSKPNIYEVALASLRNLMNGM